MGKKTKILIIVNFVLLGAVAFGWYFSRGARDIYAFKSSLAECDEATIEIWIEANDYVWTEILSITGRDAVEEFLSTIDIKNRPVKCICECIPVFRVVFKTPGGDKILYICHPFDVDETHTFVGGDEYKLTPESAVKIREYFIENKIPNPEAPKKVKYVK